MVIYLVYLRAEYFHYFNLITINFILHFEYFIPIIMGLNFIFIIHHNFINLLVNCYWFTHIINLHLKYFLFKILYLIWIIILIKNLERTKIYFTNFNFNFYKFKFNFSLQIIFIDNLCEEYLHIAMLYFSQSQISYHYSKNIFLIFNQFIISNLNYILFTFLKSLYLEIETTKPFYFVINQQ